MYSIEVRNKGEEPLVIFNDMVPIEELTLINPRLDLESGTAGTLDFSFVSGNVGFDSLNLMTTEMVVKRFDKEVWRGRVLNVEKDFYNQKTVEVEGELAYLNDTFQPQIEYDGKTLRQYVEAILSIHNQKVTNEAEPFDKTFNLGVIMSDGLIEDEITDDISYRNTSYDCTYQILKNIADKYEAYWSLTIKEENGIRKKYLNLLKEPTHHSGQMITFGNNLLDFDQKFKMENLATVCLPVGARIDDDMAGEEIVCDSIFKKRDGSSFLYTCLGSDGLPYAIDDRPDTGLDYYYRALKIVKLSDFGVKPGDKIFFTTVVESDTVGVPGKEDVWRDGVYSLLSFDGYEDNGMPRWSKGDGWPSSSVQHSDIKTFSYNIKEGITIPKNAPEDNIYFMVGGTSRPTDTRYNLQVFKQKLTSERLDEYFTLVNYPDVTPESENYKGVSHKKGELYLINDELFKKYGWVEKKIEYSDLEKTEELFKMSEKWMTETQFTQMQLDLTAYDLSLLNVKLEEIWVNTLVDVFSVPHGITNLTLPCTKMVIKFNEPDASEYSLGYSTDLTISNASNSNSNAITDAMKEQPKISSILKSSKENATGILDLFANDGVVTFVKDERDNSIIREIHILNNVIPENATGRWVYNYGGWGFQKKNNDGSWGVVEIAGTQDGALVANRVTTGNMFADRIAGGTLKLGHVLVEDETTGEQSYLDGDLKVYIDKDNQKIELLSVDKQDGVTTKNDTYWMRLESGRLMGGTLADNSGNTDWPTPSLNDPNKHTNAIGMINFGGGYGIGQGMGGMDLNARIIGINTEYLCINTGYGTSGVDIGQTQEFQYVRSINGDGTADLHTLRFRHGILVGDY